MARLGVNIDHVATIRQARHTIYPDVTQAALIAEAAGAEQITIHLREDRRHIQDSDLRALRKAVKVPLNLELASNGEIVGIACEVRPNVATFVPERRQELTTEGGLNVVKAEAAFKKHVAQLTDAGIKVSLFIDPDLEQIEASAALGIPTIELHTGNYADAKTPKEAQVQFERIKQAVLAARTLGLEVAAGHGLNYDNTALLVKEIPEIVEYNIGHSIIARAVFVGLGAAVTEMKAIVTGGKK